MSTHQASRTNIIGTRLRIHPEAYHKALAIGVPSPKFRIICSVARDGKLSQGLPIDAQYVITLPYMLITVCVSIWST